MPPVVHRVPGESGRAGSCMKLGDIDVAVIGAGISGLTAAYYLQKAGRRVALFEAEPVPGGCIGSTAQGPYVADRGPQTFTTAEPLLELVRELNLDGALTSADRAAARRYIFRHGRLNAMPTSLAGFLETPLLSTGAKCRLLMEPFVRRRIDVADESIAAFAQRRAGPDVVDALVAPIVSGIFAGDPARLSMQSTAPLLREIERRDGSVLVGSARRMRSGAVKRRAAGFIQGSRALVCAFARALGDALRTGVRVKRLSQKGASIALECEGLPESTIYTRSWSRLRRRRCARSKRRRWRSWRSRTRARPSACRWTVSDFLPVAKKASACWERFGIPSCFPTAARLTRCWSRPFSAARRTPTSRTAAMRTLRAPHTPSSPAS